MTTKPRRPHADSLERYGFLLGDLAREENAAALFFPRVRESAIRRKLAARAAGLKFQRSDNVEAAIIRRTAADPGSFYKWVRRAIRRDPRLVRKMLTDTHK